MTPPPADNERLNALERFLEHDPGNEPLLGDIFDLTLALGDVARAETALDTATAADRQAGREPPARWRARELRLLLARQRWDEAERLLADLTDRYGPQPALVHDRAWVAFNRNDFGRCVDLLSRLDITGPDATVIDAPIQTLHVRALHRADRADEAVTWADALAAADRLSAPASAAASLAGVDAARFDAARRLAERALAVDGRLVEALVAQASLLLAERAPDRALALLDHALTLAPHDGRTWSTLGFARLQRDDRDGAHEALEHAVQWMPGHVGTWLGLGWARLLLGRPDTARTAFETAIALDRNFAESHGSLAVALAIAGARAAAAAAADRALGLDAGSLSARYAKHLLDDGPNDAASVRRLARTLLAGRRTPLGDTAAAEWISADQD